ncbi:ABC transporter permease [Streptococcus moroccensis]|uniref:Oligopeptide transport system permease protein n=1 Tax=Streptococcus moroccensis TaxID=1451356 RepID=A0ABT9YTN8_9STRE|nr:ABC transporter permease [Streptococcus moroccensis]MDQ0223361.1 oligopeptide transport system permease protein [Streptococcus moroccensis]
MKKYIFNRILRSLVSIFLVTTLIYTIVYTLVPRRQIFKNDTNYTKMTKTPDTKADYENTIFEKMGYIDYYNTRELRAKASEFDASVTVEGTDQNKAIYEEYIKQLGNGWTLHQFQESGQFYATRDVPIFQRVFEFYGNLVQIDHPWRIQDASNPDLERGISIENDPSVGWSVVGSGTKHKYLLYFNSKFPYIHQNFIKLNLGTSYPTYQNIPVLQVITQGQGKKEMTDVTFPSGETKSSSVDIYSRSYRSPEKADSQTIRNFGAGDAYTSTLTNYTDPSMIASSAIIGIFGVIISYFVGLPLAILMSRFKGTRIDSFSTATLTFIMAMPSVALAYIIRTIGTTLFGLPNAFPILGASDYRSYVLPVVILGVLGIPGLAIWARRYLIDQDSSDYVRFARAKGLSEKEISYRHIFKNAMVPIVNGIPSSILSVIVGATLTESLFAFPGMGKMMIDSVKASNSSMIVGLTFIFSTLSIFAVMAGDILMTIVDPRINLSAKKGGK